MYEENSTRSGVTTKAYKMSNIKYTDGIKYLRDKTYYLLLKFHFFLSVSVKMEICINMRSIVIVITEASYHFTIRHYNIMQSR